MSLLSNTGKADARRRDMAYTASATDSSYKKNYNHDAWNVSCRRNFRRIAGQRPLANSTTEGHRYTRGKHDCLGTYAPNVIRVTLSLMKDQAVAARGYGFVAAPAQQGWTYEEDDSAGTYRSSRMVVSLGGGRCADKQTIQSTAITNNPKTQASIGMFFTGSTPGADIHFSTPKGKLLLEMNGWQMSVPNYKDGNAEILYDRQPSDEAFYQVGATFASPSDEHYYALGQNQEGYLDHRGHPV
jgi:hypothetical protein